ncbi:MAG: ribonuclease H-like domain-containing protein [Candidatus Thorarchaeota archaeon]
MWTAKAFTMGIQRAAARNSKWELLRGREGIRHSDFLELNPVLALKKRLLQQYKGQTFEEIFPGTVISNAYGEIYEIQSEEPIIIHKPKRENVISILCRIFPAIFGIRQKTAKKLHKAGYRSLQDLTRHYRWGKRATEVIDLIKTQNPNLLVSYYQKRFGKAHPILLMLSAFSQNDTICILDIETLGFLPNPLFLIGVARASTEGLLIRQLIARNLVEEPALIEECLKELATSSVLVSFNGRSYDIPYILGRAAYYGHVQPSVGLHFDLFHFSRRAWKKKLKNAKLETIEREILKEKRTMDLPSKMVPRFYRAFLRDRNPGPLVPIINHNRQDLVSLVKIFNRLCREFC